MKKLFSITIVCAIMLAMFACMGESEYHQTYFVRPSSGAALITAEGGIDSMVFVTTESYTLTTTLEASDTTGGRWFSYPDFFNSYESTTANTIVEFTMPITFTPNTTNKQRTVMFTINAGEYTASCVFVQDTIHPQAIDTLALE